MCAYIKFLYAQIPIFINYIYVHIYISTIPLETPGYYTPT